MLYIRCIARSDCNVYNEREMFFSEIFSYATLVFKPFSSVGDDTRASVYRVERENSVGKASSAAVYTLASATIVCVENCRYPHNFLDTQLYNTRSNTIQNNAINRNEI